MTREELIARLEVSMSLTCCSDRWKAVSIIQHDGEEIERLRKALCDIYEIPGWRTYEVDLIIERALKNEPPA